MSEYKAKWYFKHFVKVDQYFPSTQKCSQCGQLAHLSLKDRMFVCPHCGLVMGRDPNAALNLKVEGLRLLRNKNTKNTVATTGINACGQPAVAGWKKQEKRRFRKQRLACSEASRLPAMACA